MPLAPPLQEISKPGAQIVAKRDQTLDIFRAVAVLLVVLFHYTARLPQSVFGTVDHVVPAVSFGWVGVYFFFIISGFCIFFTLERAPTIWTFFAKRFSRIYPAFAAAAVLLFALDQVFHLPNLPEYFYRESAPTMADLLGNLLLLGGIFEWVNGSFWSITVEVQFYILIGLMAMLVKDGKKLARFFAYTALAMGIAWMLMEVASADIAVIGKLATGLKKAMIAPYLPFFALGVVGVQLKEHLKDFSNLFGQLAVLSVLIVFLMSGEGEPQLLSVQSTTTALIVAALIVVFWAYSVGWRMPHIPLFGSALAHIGLLSFSWYLLHENVGFLLLDALNPTLPYWLSVLVTMATTYGLAIVFSKVFEWRFRKPAEWIFARTLSIVARNAPRKLSEGLS
ncbi:acyltransferase family protein [Maritalea porphyrae]|uniref:acyltransferase family protein n=1 Tax=Maritalea porphyrae TaxID=880732 RepID=UPI0022B034A8|nr:acyltransferase [Maritalea porphyrae]MCZ4274047.1 acyltransferase [Maritalea porphyrae]